MYENVLKNDDISLGEYIYIWRAYVPDKACPPPYDEIIESDGYLLLVVQDYLVFFKKIKNSVKLNVLRDKSVFSTFCKGVLEGSIFDGKERYICSFAGGDLYDAYLKFKEVVGYNGVLKQTLPSRGNSYYIDDAKVVYHWMSGDEVKIKVIQGMDEEIYHFKNSKIGTQVDVIIKSGY